MFCKQIFLHNLFLFHLVSQSYYLINVCSISATESVVESLDMEPTVADNEWTAINMKPDSNYSNSLGSELMSG